MHASPAAQSVSRVHLFVDEQVAGSKIVIVFTHTALPVVVQTQAQRSVSVRDLHKTTCGVSHSFGQRAQSGAFFFRFRAATSGATKPTTPARATMGSRRSNLRRGAGVGARPQIGSS
jgi:hypothetical protein